jgi:long-chain acyl-CoA synthetase
VLDIDGKRRKSLAYIGDLSEGERINALGRIKENASIVALVRAEDREAAERRLSRAWWDWPELASSVGHRVEVACGDVSLPGMGLDGAAYTDLARRVTHMIHAAADLRVSEPIDERATNVQGTANVLEFACRQRDRD